ncbi:Bacillibactin exporter [compost metagenome]
MKWLGFGGMVLLTAAMIITGFNNNIFFMVGFLSLSGIGIGVALPCMDALITESIEKENRGTITSLYSSMRFIGVALGPPVVSLLMTRGHWVLFGTMAGVGTVGGLLTLFAVKPSEGGNKEDKPLKSGEIRSSPLQRQRAR